MKLQVTISEYIDGANSDNIEMRYNILSDVFSIHFKDKGLDLDYYEHNGLNQKDLLEENLVNENILHQFIDFKNNVKNNQRDRMRQNIPKYIKEITENPREDFQDEEVAL